MRQVKRRADPAPSRWSYRRDRLLLSPAFRAGLRFGAPFVLSFAVATGVVSDPARQAAAALWMVETEEALKARPEFSVAVLSVEGASPALAEAVRETLNLTLPMSSFDLDLPALRARLEGLAPVRKAALRVRPGGVLETHIDERVPALILRDAEGLALIDREGVRVARIAARADRPDLAVIAGEGAARHVPEARALLAAAAPLAPRLRGMIRLGDRRWSIVLDRNQAIHLPAEAPVAALERAIALDETYDMLARDVAVVDLRLQDRPVLRLNETAAGEYRRIMSALTEE